MALLGQILFVIALVFGFGFFARNVKKLVRNIRLGKDIDRNDKPKERFANMARVALGQSKMVKRPIAGFLHIVVYVGFVIINIEVLEIIIDGIFGTHRIFSFLGTTYDVLIGSFEVLAFLVFLGVVIFWIRRNVVRIKRFWANEMTGWPKNDANNILYFEMILMVFFLLMNAADFQLQTLGADHYASEAGIVGSFPVSQFLVPLIDGLSISTLIIVERTAWWLHILGILFFLNYSVLLKQISII